MVSYLPAYRFFYKHMLGFYVVLTAGGFTLMGFYAPVSYQFVYFSGVVACLVFGYAFIRFSFLPATAIGWIVGAAFIVVQNHYGAQDETARFAYAIYLLAFELLLTVICYTWERSTRNNFYLYHLLAVERDRRKAMNDELADVVEKRTIELEQLGNAIKKIKKLSGLLPICCACKKIRDDKGYWNKIETYISENSEAGFSHGICPDCSRELYGEFLDDPN
jgi:hypothetical protein